MLVSLPYFGLTEGYFRVNQMERVPNVKAPERQDYAALKKCEAGLWCLMERDALRRDSSHSFVPGVMEEWKGPFGQNDLLFQTVEHTNCIYFFDIPDFTKLQVRKLFAEEIGKVMQWFPSTETGPPFLYERILFDLFHTWREKCYNNRILESPLWSSDDAYMDAMRGRRRTAPISNELVGPFPSQSHRLNKLLDLFTSSQGARLMTIQNRLLVLIYDKWPNRSPSWGRKKTFGWREKRAQIWWQLNLHLRSWAGRMRSSYYTMLLLRLQHGSLFSGLTEGCICWVGDQGPLLYILCFYHLAFPIYANSYLPWKWLAVKFNHWFE